MKTIITKRNTSGIALIIIVVYLMIVMILCVAALTFSLGHYKSVTQRVDRLANYYYAEGGMYIGMQGKRGNVNVGIGTGTVSIIDVGVGSVQARREYTPQT